VARETRKFYPKGGNKINIVNPGIASDAPLVPSSDLTELSAVYNLGEKIVLLSLGRLVRRKGVDMTIKALERLPEPLINNLKYFVAGAGPEEEFLRQLVPAKLKDNIIFLGKLEEEEKWLWLKRCDIFIMPARDILGDLEGFGIVYLEANLSGKPVIAGDSGGVRDAVVDGYNGILVNPENIDNIKEVIIQLVSDAGLREKMGEQGRERARRDFNWEKQIAEICAIIKK
jgi:phosphatidylinositol alpha-1,6-mannosyltransferase